jgi:hypothetical protein
VLPEAADVAVAFIAHRTAAALEVQLDYLLRHTGTLTQIKRPEELLALRGVAV